MHNGSQHSGYDGDYESSSNICVLIKEIIGRIQVTLHAGTLQGLVQKHYVLPPH